MDLTHSGAETCIVTVEDTSQIGQARREAQQLALAAGFDATDAGRVALVATELATNILKHAGGGEIHVAVVPTEGTPGVQVVAVDRGPGFNLADCLSDGYSTGGTRGEGLGAVRRQAQVLDMYADHRGSVVLARLYAKGFAGTDIRFGVTQQRLADEAVCGDGWAVAWQGPAVAALLVDGLGHGYPAHEAARAGVGAWAAIAAQEPVTVMAELNAAMTGTRGGAVAMARYDADADVLRYVGIGNIAGSLQTPEASRGLASHPGIVGAQARRAQPFDFPQAGGKLLVMHSDGLQSRWSLRDYPGLAMRHPGVVTSVLYRDFKRGRDDVTVLALTVETRR